MKIAKISLLIKDAILALSGIFFSTIVAKGLDNREAAAVFLTLASFNFSKSFLKSRVVEFWLIKGSDKVLTPNQFYFGLSYETFSRFIALGIFHFSSMAVGSDYLSSLIYWLIAFSMLIDIPFIIVRYSLRAKEDYTFLSIVSLIPGLSMIVGSAGVLFFDFRYFLVVLCVLLVPSVINFSISAFYLYYNFVFPKFTASSGKDLAGIFLSEKDYFVWGSVRSLIAEPLKSGFLLIAGVFSSSSEVVILRFAVHAASIGQRALSALRPYIFNRVLTVQHSGAVVFEWRLLFVSLLLSALVFLLYVIHFSTALLDDANMVVVLGLVYCGCIAISNATNKVAMASLIEGRSKRYVILMIAPVVLFGSLLGIAVLSSTHVILAYFAFFSLYLSSSLVQILTRRENFFW
ncbi:hypothetical protein [Roseobacter sp. HKCCA0882]|uniref:hypothetical protein n=1 Tax=Roseobacter sp. HKCCA0882 TaxID=3120337 RepID=UPI0030EBECFB